jgi:hypothetical protein
MRISLRKRRTSPKQNKHTTPTAGELPNQTNTTHTNNLDKCEQPARAQEPLAKNQWMNSSRSPKPAIFHCRPSSRMQLASCAANVALLLNTLAFLSIEPQRPRRKACLKTLTVRLVAGHASLVGSHQPTMESEPVGDSQRHEVGETRPPC